MSSKWWWVACQFLESQSCCNVTTALQDNGDGKFSWLSVKPPYSCAVASPKKESKLKGLKSFIAYQLTPSVSWYPPAIYSVTWDIHIFFCCSSIISKSPEDTSISIGYMNDSLKSFFLSPFHLCQTSKSKVNSMLPIFRILYHCCVSFLLLYYCDGLQEVNLNLLYV